MRHLTGSLLFRLTVPCLVAIFTLWVSYTAFWAQKYEVDARRAFQETGARATDLFAQAVTEALWEFDQASARETLSGLRVWPGFLHAAVEDAGGLFVSYSADTAWPSDAIPSPADFAGRHFLRRGEILFFEVPVRHRKHGELGRLVAAFDEHLLATAIWSARRDAVVAAALGFTLLALLLSRIARSVIRPIVRITEAVERVAAGDLASEIPDARGVDEVGRLAGALEVFRRNAGKLVEAKAQMAANRRVADLALVDDLTGLANRRAVTEHFAQIETTLLLPPENGVASILQIDLDGFKQINDTLGHAAGDHVIKEVARRLSELSERCDLIARIGGDEFVLLVPHAPDDDTPQRIARSAIAALGQPIRYGTQTLRVGASVGIASHKRGKERMADTLVHADIALYRAKAQGKGRLVTFDEQHRREIIARKRQSDEILHAIDDGQFTPFFQGIFEAATHRLVGVEMLARWDHPEEGILPPSRFLDIASDLNLMQLIDRQVFSRAIDIFSAWSAEGVDLPRLSINVSVTRLVEPDFLDMLTKARTAGVEIDLELLESIYLDDPSDQLLWQLEEIRGLGVGLNIDDFGTGHASVAGLIQIQPDKVKIDRRFVLPILESTRARNVVETILGLCDLLEIDAVAEGVETADHARVLHDLGCAYLQGYAFMKPITAQGLHRVLKSKKHKATG